MAWPQVELSTVARIQAGGTSGQSGLHFVENGFPAYGAGGLNGKLPDWEFEDGAVVLSSIGARCGKCFLPSGKWSSLANTQLIFPDPDRVDRRFLWYLLNDEGRWHRSGTAQPYIKPADVRANVIPLPPLPEQRRIASILDRTAALSEDRLRGEALEDEFSTALYALMIGAGRWPTGPLADRIDPDDRINYGVVQPGEAIADGVPLIRVGDIRLGRVERFSLKRISSAIEQAYGRSRIRGNEILVSCVGSIGEVAVVGPDDVGSNIARAVARIPIVDPIERTFLARYLRTPEVQSYFTSELRTVSQPTLNIKQLAATPTPQVPRELQREYVARVTQIDALLGRKRRHSAKLDELFASLQYRAFRGEL